MLLHLHEWGDPGAPPVVCLHGVTAHGRRFRRLAEERLASRFRVLAPDLRGHGRSEGDPPWTLATHLADVLETVRAAGVERADWIGHSYGGRLVLELSALAPERIERAVLLDPAIQYLTHVGFDQAEHARRDYAFASPEEAVADRLDGNEATPRAAVEEEMREHLVEVAPGVYRYRYVQSAVVTMYGELCTTPPPAETLHAPTLLLYAPAVWLVQPEHVAAYRAALGDRLEVVEVPGGHVVYWDAWQETADAVERFLA